MMNGPLYDPTALLFKLPILSIYSHYAGILLPFQTLTLPTVCDIVILLELRRGYGAKHGQYLTDICVSLQTQSCQKVCTVALTGCHVVKQPICHQFSNTDVKTESRAASKPPLPDTPPLTTP